MRVDDNDGEFDDLVSIICCVFLTCRFKVYDKQKVNTRLCTVWLDLGRRQFAPLVVCFQTLLQRFLQAPADIDKQ